MTLPRKNLISVSDTPYYHIVSRCVRRAFLCGFDKETQTSYEHRRQWIEDRLRILSSLFAIDICAYAVMSNHYHLVVKISPDQADYWDDHEVIARWTQLFKGPMLVQRYFRGDCLSTDEAERVRDTVKTWKSRLSNISWFMKCLNEPIAREANKEDNCTGHFWQARYKSQALYTEKALLACMAYVELNPIRAAIADTPETSSHTSIKERVKPSFNLDKAIHEMKDLFLSSYLSVKPLLHFSGTSALAIDSGIPFEFKDYLELVDTTGRAIRESKRGNISDQFPPILERLNIDAGDWVKNSTQFEIRYHRQFRKKRPEVE